MSTIGKIDVDDLRLDAKQRQEKQSAMRMAGKREIVEFMEGSFEALNENVDDSKEPIGIRISVVGGYL